MENKVSAPAPRPDAGQRQALPACEGVTASTRWHVGRGHCPCKSGALTAAAGVGASAAQHGSAVGQELVRAACPLGGVKSTPAHEACTHQAAEVLGFKAGQPPGYVPCHPKNVGFT